MKTKRYKNWVWFCLIAIGLTVLYFWFYKSIYFQAFFDWSQENLLFFIPTLTLLKVLGIIYPPIPGGTFTLGAVPVLGWIMAYAIDFVGSLLGGCVAYFLGKKYGYSLLSKFFGPDVLTKIKKTKIKKGKEIEAVFTYKILLGGTILEAVYYGAGVLNINFTKFIIGSILSHFVVGIPTFFFVDYVLTGKNIIISVIISLLALIFIARTKGRYFE